MSSLQSYIDKRKRDGVKNRTINGPLQVVRHILNLASSEWLDDQGLTWLASAPKIRLLKEDDKREPYPLSWQEQDRLFAELPLHLREMALFKVNTGCCEQEICRLRWEWEHHIPELNTSVFIIPKGYVKNREHRLVVLNDTAKAVVNRMRGINEQFVFTCWFRGKRKPMTSMNSTAWKKARLRVDLSQVRVCERKVSTPTLTLLRCQNKTPTISPPGNVGKLKLVK